MALLDYSIFRENELFYCLHENDGIHYGIGESMCDIYSVAALYFVMMLCQLTEARFHIYNISQDVIKLDVYGCDIFPFFSVLLCQDLFLKSFAVVLCLRVCIHIYLYRFSRCI